MASPFISLVEIKKIIISTKTKQKWVENRGTGKKLRRFYSLVSATVLNTMITYDLGGKIYLACTFLSQFITEGSQGKKSRQESGVRDWIGDHEGMRLAGSLFHDLLGHLSYISPPAWGLPRAGPFHISPLSIPCLLDFPAEQSQKGTSLTAILSFQLYLSCVKLTKLTGAGGGWRELLKGEQNTPMHDTSMYGYGTMQSYSQQLTDKLRKTF